MSTAARLDDPEEFDVRETNYSPTKARDSKLDRGHVHGEMKRGARLDEYSQFTTFPLDISLLVRDKKLFTLCLLDFEYRSSTAGSFFFFLISAALHFYKNEISLFSRNIYVYRESCASLEIKRTKDASFFHPL